jgi:hypothetical protein
MTTSPMAKMWEKSVLKLNGLEIEAFGTYVLPTFYHVFFSFFFLERMQTDSLNHYHGFS